MNDENKMGKDGAMPGGAGGQDAEVRRPARLGMWALAIGETLNGVVVKNSFKQLLVRGELCLVNG